MCFVGKKLNNIADTQPNNTVKSGENRETTEILYHRENEKSVSEYNDQQMKLRMSGENTNNLMKHSDLANGYQRTPPMINNVDIVDNKGRTSLMNACVRGNGDVGQGMKQTYLYLWYPLFQAQWDRCDQQIPKPRIIYL